MVKQNKFVLKNDYNCRNVATDTSELGKLLYKIYYLNVNYH